MRTVTVKRRRFEQAITEDGHDACVVVIETD
jgi:hypothetical protein